MKARNRRCIEPFRCYFVGEGPYTQSDLSRLTCGDALLAPTTTTSDLIGKQLKMERKNMFKNIPTDALDGVMEEVLSLETLDELQIENITGASNGDSIETPTIEQNSNKEWFIDLTSEDETVDNVYDEQFATQFGVVQSVVSKNEIKGSADDDGLSHFYPFEVDVCDLFYHK